MKKLALVLTLIPTVGLGGCFSMSWDPHAPRIVFAPQEGGEVTVRHGARLRIPLANAGAGYEWRRVEPPIMAVVAEGPPDAEGQTFTPVRTGQEKLRFEYRPAGGQGEPKQVLTYDVTVPPTYVHYAGGFLLRTLPRD